MLFQGDLFADLPLATEAPQGQSSTPSVEKNTPAAEGHSEPLCEAAIQQEAPAPPETVVSCGATPDPKRVDAPSLPETLEGVMNLLNAGQSSNRRIIEMKGALRNVARISRLPLRDIPAEPAKLRPLLAGYLPASIGMSSAHWSHTRTRTLHALEFAGFDMVPGRDIGGLDRDWCKIRAALPTKGLKYGLSTFMSFCTRAAIKPHAVSAVTFDDFHRALETGSIKTNPEGVYRATVRRWNEAIAHVAALPQVTIPLEAHARFYSLPQEAFPASFTADAEAFLAYSGSQDVFHDDYVVPVKANTVKLRRNQIREMAAMLVASGFDIQRLTSLAVLVEKANLSAALKGQRERSGGMIPSIGSKAALACVIARRWVKDEPNTNALRQLARNVTHKQPGMSARNRDQLRQFELKSNLDALLWLALDVFAKAGIEKLGDVAEARRVMAALAVEIELVAPMRVNNLAGLEYERHFIGHGRGRGRDHNRHIFIPGSETKTGAAFEMLLPKESARLLDIYLAEYRSRICQGPSVFLFPNSRGERRETIAFSTLISHFVARETGLRIHAHLFRHLAGKLHLDLHPNDIETVRILLGHTNSSTTRRHYVDQNSTEAFRRYDATLSQLRAEAKIRSPTRISTCPGPDAKRTRR